MPPVPRAYLYQQLAAVLRRQILAGELKVGDRLPSESQLVRQFRASPQTVRNALGQLQRESLIVSRQGSGSFVLDHSSHQHIAIVTDLDISLPRTSYFQPAVLQEARRLLEADGLNAQVYVGDGKPGVADPAWVSKPFLRALAQRQIRAVVSHTTMNPSPWARLVAAQNLPHVGSASPHYIHVDHAAMVRAGVDRLVAQGRKKISMLAWDIGVPAPREPGPAVPSDDASDRLYWPELFSSALAAHHLVSNPAWIRNDLHPSRPGAGWSGMREIWTACSEKPDGLLICDEMLAPDVVLALGEMRIPVPQRLSIASFTNQNSAVFFPFPVTRIQIDPAAFSAQLVQGVKNLLAGSTSPATMKCAFQVIDPVSSSLGNDERTNQVIESPDFALPDSIDRSSV